MNLKEARFHAGLSQYDIALKTGIHQSRLSLIERGYLHPSNKEKKKISKVLRHKTEEIFPESEES